MPSDFDTEANDICPTQHESVEFIPYSLHGVHDVTIRCRSCRMVFVSQQIWESEALRLRHKPERNISMSVKEKAVVASVNEEEFMAKAPDVEPVNVDDAIDQLQSAILDAHAAFKQLKSMIGDMIVPEEKTAEETNESLGEGIPGSRLRREVVHATRQIRDLVQDMRIVRARVDLKMPVRPSLPAVPEPRLRDGEQL